MSDDEKGNFFETDKKPKKKKQRPKGEDSPVVEYDSSEPDAQSKAARKQVKSSDGEEPLLTKSPGNAEKAGPSTWNTTNIGPTTIADFPEVPDRGVGAIFEIGEESFLSVMKPIVSHQLEAMAAIKNIQRTVSSMLGDDDPFMVKGPGMAEARKPSSWRSWLLLTLFLVLQIGIQLYFQDSLRPYITKLFNSMIK